MHMIYRSDATATVYFAAHFVRLLFEGGYCSRAVFISLESLETSTTAAYEPVKRWRLLDAVSSMHSLSLLLAAVGMTRTTQTVLALALWPLSEMICTRVPCLLPAATIQGRRLFRFGLSGYYSRAASIRRNTVAGSHNSWYIMWSGFINKVQDI